MKINPGKFNGEFLEIIEKFNELFNVEPEYLIERLALGALAEQKAEAEVYNEPPGFVFTNLMQPDLTPKEFFQFYYEFKKKHFVEDVREQILREKETGIPISKEDQDFIDNN